MKGASPSRPRIGWVDTAKAIGMFLVFYGHFAECVAQAGNPAANLQQKVVYSFHVPLFILLSGFLAKSSGEMPGLWPLLKRQAASRLLPALFFSVLTLPFLLLQFYLGEGHLPAGASWLQSATLTLRGYTVFNVPSWFLVCLFVVELIHYFVARILTNPVRIGLVISLFYGVGWLANRDARPWSDFWFSRESVFLYAFYLLGFLLRRTESLERGGGWWSRWPLFVAGSVALWFSFGLNPGTEAVAPVVLISQSQHGGLVSFTLAAVAGGLATVGLARTVPAVRVVGFVGRHPLVFMGVNGFFFWFVNPQVARALALPASAGTVLAWCTVVTLLSLMASVPAVWALQRYLPQMVGQPKVRGPVLPPLVR